MDTPPPLDLAALSPAAQAYWLDGYANGYAYGINAGRAQVETEDAARWALIAQQSRMLANSPDYATLAERRGQHDRAERQRHLLRERGIA